jgi:hypothetical protein
MPVLLADFALRDLVFVVAFYAGGFALCIALGLWAFRAIERWRRGE